MSRCCPNCNSTSTKKNGHIHNDKQNHCCSARQFVSNPQQILISLAKRQRIRKLLRERIPLRGICRVEGVSLRWLLGFMVDLYDKLPDDFFFQVKGEAEELIICTFESEIDEMQSFVGKKANKQWVWLAMAVSSRQIIAFHVGDRSGQSALALWKSIPQRYRKHATFYTDGWCAYDTKLLLYSQYSTTKIGEHTSSIHRSKNGFLNANQYESVIPAKQHRVVKKQKRITNH